MHCIYFLTYEYSLIYKWPVFQASRVIDPPFFERLPVEEGQESQTANHNDHRKRHQQANQEVVIVWKIQCFYISTLHPDSFK